MIEMLMEPGPQNVRHWFWQITPSALRLGIYRVAHDAEIGLLGVRHHAWRYLLGVTRIGHPLVPIRWLVVLAVHYWGCVLCISPVTHRSGIGPGWPERYSCVNGSDRGAATLLSGYPFLSGMDCRSRMGGRIGLGPRAA